MLVKAVIGLLAASAAVIAAPAVNKEVEVRKDVDGHKTYVYKSDDQYGAEKYDHDNYGADMRGYEKVYAKEIVCPASYKILYTHVPVKCDCKTETRYEKPADIDFKNVYYEKEYKGYENKGY
ncbi:hypothetical protein SeMB42_g00999 [Synchytrium endobioticum]|uniref:Uncharacterized protein n=1 Tax=Synchytrium endobioticum TaxID=286115 RepID=A0A507DNW4_9FUNG|nr:hypothetical protein SeLEV6574_g02807 [Synchytrium endobioticum]TPX53101.1 hypothetical protein SeMB42_g00999 [Synchytrium endobioticum]